MAFITGKNGKVTVDAVDIPITEWSADGKADLVDRTNSQSSGKKTYGVGLEECSGSVKCHWDGAANTMDTPGIFQGADVALKCYISGSSGPYLNVASALIETVKVMAAIAGGVDIEFSWKSNGAFTWPTGSV